MRTVKRKPLGNVRRISATVGKRRQTSAGLPKKAKGLKNAPENPAVISIALNDPTLWPLRMTRTEVAAVLRIALRTLFERIRQGRVPGPDGDGTWDREKVANYVASVQEFEQRFARRQMAVARSA